MSDRRRNLRRRRLPMQPTDEASWCDAEAAPPVPGHRRRLQRWKSSKRLNRIFGIQRRFRPPFDLQPVPLESSHCKDHQ
ncbi:hypothetical protein PanWU01x14_030250, partial [Parasponia andersonii]